MKPIFVFPLLVSIFLLGNLSAQGPDTLWLQTNLWTKTYGGTLGDAGYSIEKTSDGGFIIGGVTNSFGAGFCDLYLIKIDSLGTVLWERVFGGERSEFGFSVKETPDSGFIVVGYTWSFGSGLQDIYLVKTDREGRVEWTRTFGGENYERGQSVTLTRDGGYVIVGTTWSYGAGEQDIYCIKIDEKGNTRWSKTYGGMFQDMGYHVEQTFDGGFILVGVTTSFGKGEQDVYLVKSDSLGNIIWSKTYGGIKSDFGRCVRQTEDGGYIITGYTTSYGNGGSDIYIIKTDGGGDTLWTRTVGGSGTDGSNSILQTGDGGYIIAGWTKSFGAGDYDVYAVKTDSTGTLQWSRTFGGPDWDRGNAVAYAHDGGFIITGHTRLSGKNEADVYVIKINP
jgi:hypothetical protein